MAVSYEELERQAIGRWKEMQNDIRLFLEFQDSTRNQEIKAYIEKAVADIARKCGTDQDEVWLEMNYWSNYKV